MANYRFWPHRSARRQRTYNSLGHCHQAITLQSVFSDSPKIQLMRLANVKPVY
jgi:hypothetical protein